MNTTGAEREPPSLPLFHFLQLHRPFAMMDAHTKGEPAVEMMDSDLIKKGYIDGITILDLSGEILFSAKFNRKLAHTDECRQLIGQKFLEVYPNLTPESSTLYRAMQLGHPIYEERQYLKRVGKDGIVISSLSFPIKNGERIVGAIDLSTQEDSGDDGDGKERIQLSRESFRESRTDQLNRSSQAIFEVKDIIAIAPRMRQAREYIPVVASCDLPVMICGETGTGKDVFAQAIHNASPRRDGPFIAQNCAAIPETLLESVLFGTEKGAFTGAVKSKGLLELADRGTLFLDELNSMPLYLQSKLLRVLQDGTFRSLGSEEIKHVDVKVIAALNRDPMEEIRAGRLREDIYYRLSIMSISIPPLRERKEDIRAFVEAYVHKHNRTFGKHIRFVSQELIRNLQAYRWPGNVRELEQMIVYGMSVVSPEADTLTFSDIQKKFGDRMGMSDDRLEILPCPLAEEMKNHEKKLITRALVQTEGNVSEAARVLGLPRQTLQHKIKQHGLNPEEYSN